MRRIGVLLPFSADDAESQVRMGAFLQTLALSGWTIGRNLRIDIRWAGINADDIRKHAAELAALTPDVIRVGGGSGVGPLLESTRTVPVVFTVVNDPVGAGYVENLARPGGNVTGFMSFEFSLSAKWLELLKQIAPSLMRVAVLRDATQSFAMSSFAAVQAVAPSLGVEVIPINMRDAGEIERSVVIFARSPNGGLIPMASAAAIHHRDLILTLTSRHKLPAIYWDRFFFDAGYMWR
jgi:putative tryptophan/tyrosine transport system substrate-binding protein